MQFVDEQNNVAFAALNFFDGGLQAFFKLPTEAATCDHAAQVQIDNFLTQQDFRDVVIGNFLGQPFDNSCLAHARFSDQHRVILGSAAENLNDTQYLIVAPDNWIELAFLCHAGQVAAIFFQRAVTAFGLRIGDSLSTAKLLDDLHYALFSDAGIFKDARQRGSRFSQNRQK